MGPKVSFPLGTAQHMFALMAQGSVVTLKMTFLQIRVSFEKKTSADSFVQTVFARHPKIQFFIRYIHSSSSLHTTAQVEYRIANVEVQSSTVDLLDIRSRILGFVAEQGVDVKR